MNSLTHQNTDYNFFTKEISLRMLVGDQPVGPVTKLWEQRFESGFGFPDGF